MWKSVLLLAGLLAPVLATAAPGSPEDQPRTLPDAAPEEESTERSIFDCGRLRWLNECDEINKNIREHPQAPIRARNAEGLEFNFPPGTSAAVMQFMLNPTPQSAKAFADHLEGHYMVAQKAATLFEAEVERRGGALGGTKTIEEIIRDRARKKEIKPDKVKAWFFYHSEDPVSQAMLFHVGMLRKDYPDLPMASVQVDLNPSALAKVNEEYALGATLLEGPKRKQIIPRLTELPAVWVQRTGESTVIPLSGFNSEAQLEKRIAEISNQ